MIENRPLTSLRAVAAIWVIFSHIAPSFTATWSGLSWRMARDGYMGVDMFFVLSGFILAAVYQEMTLAGTPRFFLKRFLRLYPLNIAVLAAMAALSWTIMPLGAWTDPKYLPIYILMLEGYASWPIPAWNPVTWSVGIELACYACLPWVIMGLRRLQAAAIAVISILLLLASWWAQGFCHGWPVGWHALMRGMSSFWPGVALGSWALRMPRWSSRWTTPLELGCMAALLLVTAAEALRWIPLVTGILVLSLSFDTGIVARAFRREWIFWLGTISFSIYMLFGITGTYLDWLKVFLAKETTPALAMILFIVLYLLATITLSSLTYLAIEVPCRKLARPSAK